jgi:hypothetical protein
VLVLVLVLVLLVLVLLLVLLVLLVQVKRMENGCCCTHQRQVWELTCSGGWQDISAHWRAPARRVRLVGTGINRGGSSSLQTARPTGVVVAAVAAAAVVVVVSGGRTAGRWVLERVGTAAQWEVATEWTDRLHPHLHHQDTVGDGGDEMVLVQFNQHQHQHHASSISTRSALASTFV